MIGRVILAALLAGIAAGIVMGVIQHVRLTPLIVEAETYEQASTTLPGHDAAAAPGTEAAATSQPAMAGHDHDHDDGWKPQDGLQRTMFTTFASAMTGAGFAAILAAVSLLSGLPLTRQNGLIWGLCGFLAVSLATAAGLPPELPGMPAAELLGRQTWWVATVAATAAGIYLAATQSRPWALPLAAVLVLAPHVIGAPVAPHEASMVPPDLAARFVANSIAANAVFWCCIGLFLGLALDRTAKEIYAT